MLLLLNLDLSWEVDPWRRTQGLINSRSLLSPLGSVTWSLVLRRQKYPLSRLLPPPHPGGNTYTTVFPFGSAFCFGQSVSSGAKRTFSHGGSVLFLSKTLATHHIWLFSTWNVVSANVLCRFSHILGISQARILEWIAISSSRGPSRPRDQTHISYVCLWHWHVGSLPLAPPGKLKKKGFPDRESNPSLSGESTES